MTHLPTTAAQPDSGPGYEPLDCQIVISEKKHRRRGYITLEDSTVAFKMLVLNPEGNPPMHIYTERFYNPRKLRNWQIVPDDGAGHIGVYCGSSPASHARRATARYFKRVEPGQRSQMCVFDVKKIIDMFDLEESGKIHFKYEGKVECCLEVEGEREIFDMPITSNTVYVFHREADHNII